MSPLHLRAASADLVAQPFIKSGVQRQETNAPVRASAAKRGLPFQWRSPGLCEALPRWRPRACKVRAGRGAGPVGERKGHTFQQRPYIASLAASLVEVDAGADRPVDTVLRAHLAVLHAAGFRYHSLKFIVGS